ncbi:MAG: FlgD immunoglobulin-like domain containing protein [Candidatus Krumholzibacteriia bacterium]
MDKHYARISRVPLTACLAAALFTSSLLSPPTGATRPARPAPASPDKTLVTDGSFVHDVGRLACNITNFGLIGSQPGAPSTFSAAPSCQWPAPGAAEYLWGAGLWVGAELAGQQLVSTGEYEHELIASADPRDTLYRSAMGAPGGHRYPEVRPDDDGDGREDEDPLNGLDDDGDGLIDEDFAAIGEQYFRCTMTDPQSLIYPQHVPLGLEVVQQSMQWSDPYIGDAFGLDFTIRNAGTSTLANVYAGFFADCDIGLRTGIAFGEDDLAGYYAGAVQASDGTYVLLEVGYMYDDDGDDGTAPGYIGFLLLDHTTDPAGATAPAAAGIASFQILSGQTTFELGGDPTNDSQRYALLSSGGIDANIPPIKAGDYRVLISSGPFASLAPGEQIFYRIAIVLGSGLEGMLANAADMVVLYRGAAFNRDGDPSTGVDGREYVVHWLRPADIPVPAYCGLLAARHAGGGVRLDWEANLDTPSALAVVRRIGALERRFEGSALGDFTTGGLGLRGGFTDMEAGGWPRVYSLLLREAPVETPLATIALDGPPAATLRLDAWPNPANPRVTVSFGLPTAGPATLTVHDARGRRVRTLLAAQQLPGDGQVVWDGADDAGRQAPSGVYELRLDADGRVARRSVTLVR